MTGIEGGWKPATVAGGTTTDHGALTGLDDQDHNVPYMPRSELALTFAARAANLTDLASVATAWTNLGGGASGQHPDSFFLKASNNLSDLGSVTAARSTLGIATSMVNRAVGTTSADVAAGDRPATVLATHTGLATGAHAATAISFSPSGTLSSIQVQGAIDELQADIAGLGGGAGAPGKTNQPTLFIASSTAPQYIKDRADFVCDGTDDQRTINEAVYAAGNQYKTSDANTDWYSAPALNNAQTNTQSGSVKLSEGIFNLSGPIVVPSRGFCLQGAAGWASILFCQLPSAFDITDTGTGVPDGWDGGTGEKAMIMFANDANGSNTVLTQIRDININCNGQTGSSWSVSGIYYYDTTGAGDYHTYGQPIPNNTGDGRHLFERVRISHCKSGIYWTSTSAQRGVAVVECQVFNFYKDAYYASASDGKFFGCTANTLIAGTPNPGAGFRLNSGNVVLVHCSASYVRNTASGTPSTSGTGFQYEGSSRSGLIACVAQDCNNGFDFNGLDALMLVGLRADTQEGSTAGIGFDFGSCDQTIAQGIICQVRSNGYHGGAGIQIDSSTAHEGMLDAYVGATSAGTNLGLGGNQVQNESGTLISTSTDLPTGITYRIARQDTSTLVSLNHDPTAAIAIPPTFGRFNGSANHTGSATLTMTYPTRLADNDYAFMAVGYTGTLTTDATAAGWTLIRTDAPSGSFNVALYRRRLTASMAGTTFNMVSPSGQNWAAAMEVVRGAKAYDANGYAFSTALNVHAAPPVTLTGTTSVVLSFALERGTPSTAVTLYPDQLVAGVSAFNVGGGSVSVVSAYKQLVVEGAGAFDPGPSNDWSWNAGAPTLVASYTVGVTV
jgi:hypothetical protein